MKVINELHPSSFVSSPEIEVKTWSKSADWSKSQTSPELRIIVHKPWKTPGFRKSNTLTVFALPRDTKIASWHLKTMLLIQIRHTRRESLATTWFEGMAEYGTGQGQSEAITDLVNSLGEYRESLEKREKNLGGSARKELDYLRRLIERAQ